MLTTTQNVEQEEKEETDLPRGDIIKKDIETKEGDFRRFRGFDTGFMEETLPLMGKTEAQKDDISGSTISQLREGVCDMDASQQAVARAETSLHECLEVDAQVSTASEGQATNKIGMKDIKKKIPGLADLIMPTPPASPCNERNTESVSSTDSDIDEAGSAVMQPLLRRISVSAPGRLKTRLQDPPPLTPAMQHQLTRCSSSLLHRRASLLAANEQQNARPDDVSGVKTSLESNQTNTANSISNPGSFNKNSRLATLVSEEEGDPLDDDIILASKKKRLQESKWDIYLQWIILLLLITFLACLVKIKLLKRVTFLGLDLWRWVGLTLAVFCGRLISGWIMKLLEMLIEKHYILKKRVLYFVYGLRRAVKNCLWLALVLGVWESTFRGLEDSTAVNVLTKILWCLFTASLSWMLKVLAVKVAASSFHRKAYFDRIQECIFNQYLLEVLSGPPSMAGIVNTELGKDGIRKQSTHSQKKKYKKQFGESQTSKLQKNPVPHIQRSRRLSTQISIETPGFTTVEVGELPAPSASDVHMPSRRKISMTNQGPVIARSPIPIEQEKLQQLTSDTVSVLTMKRLMKLIRNTNISTYSSIISQETDEGEISSEVQAKYAAKQIFYNMARPGQKSLTMKDFLYFLHEEQALRAFGLFEITDSGEITKKSLVKWVVGAYKERRALSLTLNDNKTVVAKLHKVLDVVLAMTLFILFFLIFGVESSKLLVFFSSVFLPSVFVFGNSARTTFESLIFLFVTHPFDVGDRIVVDGQNMLVEEINVLNTILLGSSNEKVYFPNSLLSMKVISNYYRSPDQGDAIEFQINMSTPIEKLGILKERMQRYIESLPQFWYPDFRIVCDKILDSNKMNMAIWMRHRLNFQDGGERFQRRSNMLLYLKQQLEDLGIGYQLPGQEITVRGVPLLSPPPTLP